MLSKGKKIHILGISGTFMAGVAVIAKQCGYIVSGHDKACYSPMREQLQKCDIPVITGYSDADLPAADCYIIGNTISRGNPLLEHIMMQGLPYTSGPQWLAENILQDKWVVAIAGTHGKTTTSSMVTWLLEQSGINPSFLIGGVVENLGVSARLSSSDVFVIEADEYDTAFFDKRPKFMHYRPRTLILNNLEFDHADIYNSLSDIAKQFSYLIKTVPADGMIIYPQNDKALQGVIQKGCWSKYQTFNNNHDGASWFYSGSGSYSNFKIGYDGREMATVNSCLLGEHNAQNSCAAVIAANHVGVPAAVAAKGVSSFSGVKRRLELKGCFAGIKCYDDFGHHPTAINKVLSCLRSDMAEGQRLFALVELGSYTLRNGIMSSQLEASLTLADRAWVAGVEEDNCSYNWHEWAANISHIDVAPEYSKLSDMLIENLNPGDIVVSFSSRNVSNIHDLLKEKLLPSFC